MKSLHWLRQPTTLQGLSFIIAGLAGARTGALSSGLATTLIGAAIPLLLPDNSTARAIASAAIPTAVDALEKSAMAGKEPHKPG